MADPLGRSLSSEDVLVIADEVCESYLSRLRSLPAICAIAAVTDAAVAGVPVHRSGETRDAAIRDAVNRLQPIQDGAANAAFADVLISVLHSIGDIDG